MNLKKNKLINQTLENGKKHNYEPYFGPFALNLGRQKKICGFFSLLAVRHSSKLLFYAIYRKTNESNLRKWQKT